MPIGYDTPVIGCIYMLHVFILCPVGCFSQSWLWQLYLAWTPSLTFGSTLSTPWLPLPSLSPQNSIVSWGSPTRVSRGEDLLVCAESDSASHSNVVYIPTYTSLEAFRTTNWSYSPSAILCLPLVASPLLSTFRHQGFPSSEAREERDPCWHPVLPSARAECAQLQPLTTCQLQPQILPQLRGRLQPSAHQPVHPRQHGTILTLTCLWKGRLWPTQTRLCDNESCNL